MIALRNPRHRDNAHLAFVRQQPCCVCPPGSNRRAEAAHIRMACPARGKRPTGMQEKPSDMWTVPLCPYHHRIGVDSQHANNERAWWTLRGIDPFAIALRLWDLSGGAERAKRPQIVKPRKIKARKQPEQRKKIRSGRKTQSNPVIQSRGFDRRHHERPSA